MPYYPSLLVPFFRSDFNTLKDRMPLVFLGLIIDTAMYDVKGIFKKYIQDCKQHSVYKPYLESKYLIICCLMLKYTYVPSLSACEVIVVCNCKLILAKLRIIVF